MDFFVTYHWYIFISIEILSVLSILLFGLFRYYFNQQNISNWLIASFIMLLLTEALLGLYVYVKTGQISTFVIIIAIFLVYACTFGIVDFIRLDRWMKDKIGKLRGVQLLTENEKIIMERNKSPAHLAKKYRMTSIIHLGVFVIGQSIFWYLGTDSISEMTEYLLDYSWLNEDTAEHTPYPNDLTYGIGVIWGIAFIADFIYSWSYTLFPNK